MRYEFLTILELEKRIVQMLKKMRYIGIFILLFFSGLLIFKNSLFFTENILISKQIDNSVLTSYSYSNNQYVPIDYDASIYLGGCDISANVIEIYLERGLEEDAIISLYDVSDETNSKLIEQKIVRSGYNTIKFYFANIHLNAIKIIVQSKDYSHYVNLSDGNIYIKESVRTLFQRDAMYCLKIFGIFIGCILGTFVLYNSRRKKKDVINLRSERETNLELLRIICMFFLVAHHFAVHGGLLGLAFSIPKYIGLIFLPVGKICFIAYVAISMFFLVDGKNKSERFLRCWLEVLFYSVTLTAITWLMGGSIRFRDFISSFFVMSSNSHGFAASYMLFLLIYPFVLKATKNTTKKQARYLLVVFFVIQILSQILKTWTGYTQPIFSELTLFVFCYILSLNLKRYPIKLLDNKWFDFVILLLIYSYVFLINFAAYTGNLNEITVFLCGITGDESSIFYIIGGYALFYLFKNIHIPNNKMINSIATYTFGVLLIHDHNFFRHLFWNEVVRTQIHFESNKFILWFAISITGIYIACSTIDFLRIKMLEEKIVNKRWFRMLSEMIDKALQEEM